jgi:hypothetical protein
MRDRPHGHNQRQWTFAAATLAAVLLDLLLYPYTFGQGNHAIQIPMVHQWHDASLYPGDPFMATSNGYVTFFWPAIAWLTEWLPLQPTFFAGHVVTLVARYAALLALTGWMFPRERWAPYTAVWLYLWWQPTIGGESLHWSYWAHTPFATALGLWAIVLVLRERVAWGFALAGLVANIHLLQAVYLLWMFVVGLFLEYRRLNRTMIAGIGLWFLLAAPVLFVLVRSSGLGAPADLGTLLRTFFPVHYFASSFPIRQWVAVAAILTLFAAASAGTRDQPAARRTAHLALATLAFLVLGLLSEIAPVGALLKLHVFRASAYFISLALCLAAGWIIQQSRNRIPARYRPFILWTGLLTVALIPVQPHLSASGVWSVTAVAIIAGGVILAFKGPQRFQRHAAIAAAASLVMLLVGLHGARMRDQRSDFDAAQDWFQVQQWAEAHTPRDARFLTPPYLTGFRVFARRPVVAEWLDGAAIMWDREYARYWRQWLHELDGRFDAASWHDRSEQEITSLARRYGATYIVMPREYQATHPWSGDVIYRNRAYFVAATNSTTNSRSERAIDRLVARNRRLVLRCGNR